jgi:hypothetical protein
LAPSTNQIDKEGNMKKSALATLILSVGVGVFMAGLWHDWTLTGETQDSVLQSPVNLFSVRDEYAQVQLTPPACGERISEGVRQCQSSCGWWYPKDNERNACNYGCKIMGDLFKSYNDPANCHFLP